METQELHRGRLIDHIQLVLRDLSAAQTFYAAIFDVLNIPIGGVGDGFFWADELFVSICISWMVSRSGVRATSHPSHTSFCAAPSNVSVVDPLGSP